MSIHQLLKGHNLKLVVTARRHADCLFGSCSGFGFQRMLQVTSGKCEADFALNRKAWKGVLKLCVKYVWMDLCIFKCSYN